jgi:hypothetical protein
MKVLRASMEDLMEEGKRFMIEITSGPPSLTPPKTPGEPPGRDTGRLQGHISTKVWPLGARVIATIESTAVSASSGQRYPWILEEGWESHGPFPFVKPTMEHLREVGNQFIPDRFNEKFMKANWGDLVGGPSRKTTRKVYL